MITKNYIKMCGKANEIQKKWKPKIGDRFHHIKGKYNIILTELYFRTYLPHKVGFWLPTQEQLQEMIITKGFWSCIIEDNRWFEFVEAVKQSLKYYQNN